MDRITTLEALHALYGEVGESSRVKEVDRITPHYRTFIEASPFAVLATSGPGGLDCSPRGDRPGFVRVADEKTLLLPDRRGNNRVDSLENILHDPRVGLLFLVPGVGEALRVNGRAEICVGADLLESFIMDGKRPRSVLAVSVEAVYFQCARAIVRSDLWNPEKRIARNSLPSVGEILSALSQKSIDGEAYDRVLPERLKATLW
jgi:PPOX class probable FMN-dependent enzyme